MPWDNWMAGAWGLMVAAVTISGALAASVHAILYKRDTRATVLWVSFIMLAPIAGPICYLLLGINRIKRRASLLRRAGPRFDRGSRTAGDEREQGAEPALPEAALHRSNFMRLTRLMDTIADMPLVAGNRVVPLENGDRAYPEMLDAIESARHTIVLQTYIFDRDAAGLRFVDVLSRAVDRGVEVRVLVDDTGVRYSLPSVMGTLRRAGIRVARFLPTIAPHKFLALNMRSHRKLLVVDGTCGFTGGMNIRAGNLTNDAGRLRIRDIHFRVEGPVVAHLRDVFADDWLFTTGELLDSPMWHPALSPAGNVWARGVVDGPDVPLDRLRWALLGGLACAHERVRIVTPYFLPDTGLISALNTAALRGVSVEILLPENNNLPFVKWAATAHLWQVLERGCRVFHTSGPFDHSKVMVVDGQWSLIGSANWDPRSMRLNFEFDLECFSAELASQLERWFEAKRAQSREVTLEDVNSRAFAVRLRDGIARLATPFL